MQPLKKTSTKEDRVLKEKVGVCVLWFSRAHGGLVQAIKQSILKEEAFVVNSQFLIGEEA